MAKSEQSLLSKKELLEIFINHRVKSPFPGDWESLFKGLGDEFKKTEMDLWTSSEFN